MAQPHSILQTPSMHAPPPEQVPCGHVGRQPCSSTSQLSTGPHWAHCIEGAVPAGQGVGQPIFVQPSCPFEHVHLLQLNGS